MDEWWIFGWLMGVVLLSLAGGIISVIVEVSPLILNLIYVRRNSGSGNLSIFIVDI